jgi:aminopeptidase N
MITDSLADELAAVYNPTESGKRALKNIALGMLVMNGSAEHQELAWHGVQNADNMTDRAAALGALVNSNAPQREQSLEHFAIQFADEPLAMDKWFMMQATMQRQPNDAPVLDRVLSLIQREDFTHTNPNRVRSLIGAFCSGNLAEFHADDGRAYQFWLDQVKTLDAANPQVAARLARAMDRWRKFDAPRQQRMKATLSQLASTDGLSRDVAEIVHKALAADG